MMLKSVIVFGVLAAFCAALPAISLEDDILNSQIDFFEVRDVVSDIEAIIEKAIQKITDTAEGLVKDVEKALDKIIATAEDLTASAEKAIRDAVTEVEKQIEALGDKLNDCAKEEAAKLESVAEAGIEKVEACVSDSHKKAEAIAEDTKKKLLSASDKVQEAAKPIRACGELSSIQQLACKLKEEVKFGVEVSKISAGLVADAAAAAYEIGKLRIGLGGCVGKEIGLAVAAVAKVGVDVAQCIVD